MPSELLFFSPENTFLCHYPNVFVGHPVLWIPARNPRQKHSGAGSAGMTKFSPPLASQRLPKAHGCSIICCFHSPKIVMSPDFKPGDIISLLLRTTNSFISCPDS